MYIGGHTLEWPTFVLTPSCELWTKNPQVDSATLVVSDHHKFKNFDRCMTSSEPKMRLWILCPQMTLHDVPKMSKIGVKHILRDLHRSPTS